MARKGAAGVDVRPVGRLCGDPDYGRLAARGSSMPYLRMRS
jgi:hypothetical protein